MGNDPLMNDSPGGAQENKQMSTLLRQTAVWRAVMDARNKNTRSAHGAV